MYMYMYALSVTYIIICTDNFAVNINIISEHILLA